MKTVIIPGPANESKTTALVENETQKKISAPEVPVQERKYSINEARQAFGLKPLSGCDDPLIERDLIAGRDRI